MDTDLPTDSTEPHNTSQDHATEAVLRRFDAGWPATLDVGDGWLPLIVELDQALAALDPHYTLHQVKEKFGTLRFYYGTSAQTSDTVSAEMAALVAAAEQRSAQTCEQCGQPGQLVTHRGWRQTLCATHRR